MHQYRATPQRCSGQPLAPSQPLSAPSNPSLNPLLPACLWLFPSSCALDVLGHHLISGNASHVRSILPLCAMTFSFCSHSPTHTCSRAHTDTSKLTQRHYVQTCYKMANTFWPCENFLSTHFVAICTNSE